MKNKFKFILIFLFLASLFTSCKKQAEQPELISAAIEIQYQNVDGIAGNPVDALLINNSEYCIKFDLADGLNIFVGQNEKWIEIPNLVEFLGDSVLILQPKGNLSSRGSVNLRPDMANLVIKSPTEAYALLTGYLCDDDNIQIQKKIPFTINP